MIKKDKNLIGLIVIWIIVALAGGIYYQLEKTSKIIYEVDLHKNTTVSSKKEQIENIKFYLPNTDFTKLVVKEESIPLYYKVKDKVEVIAKKSFENLYNLKLLKSSNIEIYNIYQKDNTIYLDCSNEILDLKEPKKENILAIYSLVNSITEVPGIKKVKILVSEKEENGNFSRTYLRNLKI